jgi:hypothetical protein
MNEERSPQDKAAALAEKHGASIVSIHPGKSILLIGHQFEAMLADHKQQAIEELAAKTKVMPPVVTTTTISGSGVKYDLCLASKVREAIATMQAKLEASDQFRSLQNEQIDELKAKLTQADARRDGQCPVGYDKTDMNAYVQNMYDSKMQEGKHGHYETLFHCVHQAIKRVHGVVEKRDLMYSTVAMQERHDQRIENIVGTLECIKKEQAAKLSATQPTNPTPAQAEKVEHPEDRYVRGYSELDCPMCGGSGHKDDAKFPGPVGKVESAVFGASGFHVYLLPNQRMPKVGTRLYTHPPTDTALVDAAEKALVAMEDVMLWRKTGIGRPPEQLMLFEIDALRDALLAHGRKT